jgi:hypothetical protein
VRFRLGGAPVRAVSAREQVLAGAGR